MNNLIPALKKDEELIAEMDSYLSEKEGFHLWWLGQSGYLLQWNGKRVLIDPYLSDSLTKKYEKTEKPHVRLSEQVVRPELLIDIAIVTSSHNHTDHLDAETLIPILKNNPKIKLIIPEANRDFVSNRLQCESKFPIGINFGDSVTIDGFSFKGIPAKHNELTKDEYGNYKFMGYIIQFGNFSVYHSGDTLLFEGLEEILKPYTVDVAILPINGNKPERQVAGNLDFKEAVELGMAIGAKYIIPCHYDMFSFNTADVKDFIHYAEEKKQDFKVLKGGQKFYYPLKK